MSKNPSALLIAALFAVVISAAFMNASPASADTGYSLDDMYGYWQQGVSYSIKANLDTKNHFLTGQEVILYTNNSPDTLEKFYLHLYPNAYRDKASALIRDYMKGTLYFFMGLPKSMRGWMNVDTLMVNGSKVEFDVTGTILSSKFPRPLLPGESVSITIAFSEKVKRKVGRSGYMGQHYDMGQWYPKMVVYDHNGWHPDQFRLGEFYGEFATYDVSVTLPDDYVIAATGDPVEGDPGWKEARARAAERAKGAGDRGAAGNASRTKARGMSAAEKAERLKKISSKEYPNKTVTFHAEKVHDFAFVADPSFALQDSLYKGIEIMVFYRPWNRATWQDSVMARTIRTIDWLERIAGPFPYKRMSVVDTPTRGGMEYPMLVMNGGADDALIRHEVGHMYFYGALANDERREAWLDEGFTQFQTFWYAEEHYGPYGEAKDKRSFPYNLFPRRKMWEGIAEPVIQLKREGFDERISTPAQNLNNYTLMAYVKAPLFLRALRYTVGDETFEKILKEYYKKWKFKHVDEEAFLSVCKDLSGMDLDEFFRQWLHTTKDCDYAVKQFKVEQSDDIYKAHVKIERKGELMMPLTLAFRLKNGNTATERVDGFLRTIEKDYTFDVKPVSVAINPDNEILDIYQLDNFQPRKMHLSLDVPFNTYYPENAYDFRLLPIGFYNDIDGGKLGLRMRGSYDNYFRRFTLQGLYGFESGSFDLYGSLDFPTHYFRRDGALSAEGYYREGRQGGRLEISKIRRKYKLDPLAQHFRFYLTYNEMTDSSYTYPGTYDSGKDIKAGLSFAIAPTTDIFASSLFTSYERSIWGSDFNYERFKIETRFTPPGRSPLPVKMRLRFFYGQSTIDPPSQERFNLGGAGSLAREGYFWLRSVGAFPRDYYDNFHLAGDANMRGYTDAAFNFKRVFSSNIELSLPLPISRTRGFKRKLGLDMYIFYDWGKVMDKGAAGELPPSIKSNFAGGYDPLDHIISDFGVGVKIWRLRIDLPLYLREPGLKDETEKWRLRWLIGINGVF